MIHVSRSVKDTYRSIVLAQEELESKLLEIKQEKPEVEKPIININNKNIIKKEKKVNKNINNNF